MYKTFQQIFGRVRRLNFDTEPESKSPAIAANGMLLAIWITSSTKRRPLESFTRLPMIVTGNKTETVEGFSVEVAGSLSFASRCNNLEFASKELATFPPV